LPDHDIKAFFGVEGKHDINFLRRISHNLAAIEHDIPDLSAMEQVGKLVFVPLGGSNLDLWITTLAGLQRPEFYLTDRDLPPPAPPRYQQQLTDWSARGCTAWATSKRTLENYLHPSVIAAVVPEYTGIGSDFEDVPLLFAQATHSSSPDASAWAEVSEEQRRQKVSAAKKRLNTVCVENMTPELLTQSDPNDDIRIWLRAIGQVLNE
jgi:putative ATP-dependent endonuclease of OLD family